MVKGYCKITKTLPSIIMKCDSKKFLNQLLKTGDNNAFKDLPIKMQFSKSLWSF